MSGSGVGETPNAAATGILSRRPTRTRPVAAEAEEAEASAAELAFSVVTELSDASGGVLHPTPPIFDG